MLPSHQTLDYRCSSQPALLPNLPELRPIRTVTSPLQSPGRIGRIGRIRCLGAQYQARCTVGRLGDKGWNRDHNNLQLFMIYFLLQRARGLRPHRGNMYLNNDIRFHEGAKHLDIAFTTDVYYHSIPIHRLFTCSRGPILIAFQGFGSLK